MTYKFLDLTGLKQTITQIFSKLKAVALSGSYTDLINKPTIVNNGTTTTTNTVLDGRMGKTLADKDANLQSQITSLNSALATTTQFRNEGSFLDVNVTKNSFMAQVRAGAYLRHAISEGTNQQLYGLGLKPVHSIFRRYRITDGDSNYKDFILQINADGYLFIQPVGSDLAIGDAINFTETFFIK